MNPVTRAVKATYNFFAGDMIILVTVIVAFIAVGLLVGHTHVSNVITAIVFIALIAGGLTTTLSRELVGRKRA